MTSPIFPFASLHLSPAPPQTVTTLFSASMSYAYKSFGYSLSPPPPLPSNICPSVSCFHVSGPIMFLLWTKANPSCREQLRLRSAQRLHPYLRSTSFARSLRFPPCPSVGAFRRHFHPKLALGVALAPQLAGHMELRGAGGGEAKARPQSASGFGSGSCLARQQPA